MKLELENQCSAPEIQLAKRTSVQWTYLGFQYYGCKVLIRFLFITLNFFL